MNSKDSEFSWPILFIVTSVCFFGFGLFIRFIDGYPSQSGLFLKISLVTFIVSVILFIKQFVASATDND